MIDGVLYDMAAPAVTHQEIAFEIADVKNQKVIVYDLGDDFGENMLYEKSGTKTRNGEKHMKLTILGTGNATVSECYNTCYAISDEGKNFLVDAGGGNRILKVLKDTGIDMNDIHDIFVTHEHVDHVLGIIWLVRMIGQRMNQGKYEGDLRIYCHE